MTKTLRENPQELRSFQGQQRTGPQSIYGSLKGLVNIYSTVGKFPRRSQSSQTRKTALEAWRVRGGDPEI